ncbi:MAG: hypothetical protein ACI8XO_000316 [Verrucomicrobiales bacterium]|jgi:hypothetical protein
MNRFPEFQTDLLFSDSPPAEAEAKVEGTESHAAPAAADEHGGGHTATTTEPAPLAPQMQGVLEEPISSGQIWILILFGFAAFLMIVAMTRFQSDKDYGD